LNFARTTLHVTPRICANPSWTNVPRYTTNDSWLNFANPSSSYTSQNFNGHLIGGKNVCILSHLGALQEDTIITYVKRHQKLKSWGLAFLKLNLADIWLKIDTYFQPGAPDGDILYNIKLVNIFNLKYWIYNYTIQIFIYYNIYIYNIIYIMYIYIVFNRFMCVYIQIEILVLINKFGNSRYNSWKGYH
jgi:hypothetical protein